MLLPRFGSSQKKKLRSNPAVISLKHPLLFPSTTTRLAYIGCCFFGRSNERNKCLLLASFEVVFGTHNRAVSGLSFLSEEKKKKYDGTRYLTISLFSKYALARMSCILWATWRTVQKRIWQLMLLIANGASHRKGQCYLRWQLYTMWINIYILYMNLLDCAYVEERIFNNISFSWSILLG